MVVQKRRESELQYLQGNDEYDDDHNDTGDDQHQQQFQLFQE